MRRRASTWTLHVHIAPPMARTYLAAELDRLKAALLLQEGASTHHGGRRVSCQGPWRPLVAKARVCWNCALPRRSPACWPRTTSRRRAVDLLAPIHGWFTEGFDTTDLRRRTRCWMSLASSLASGPRPASPCCVRAGPPARTMEREIRGGDVPREGVQRDLLPEEQERLPIRVAGVAVARRSAADPDRAQALAGEAAARRVHGDRAVTLHSLQCGGGAGVGELVDRVRTSARGGSTRCWSELLEEISFTATDKAGGPCRRRGLCRTSRARPARGQQKGDLSRSLRIAAAVARRPHCHSAQAGTERQATLPLSGSRSWGITSEERW